MLTPQALSLTPGAVLKLPLSLQGYLCLDPLSGSRSSAWIPLPVWLRRGKAGFYGKRLTPFLPRRRVPPCILCRSWWVLWAAAQPVVMGGTEKNGWEPRGPGVCVLPLPHCPILSLADPWWD